MRRLVAFTSVVLTMVAIGCGGGDDPTAPTTPNQPAATPQRLGPDLATASNGEGLSITTDKDDYSPGDTVWFTGAGWQLGDTLDIVLTDDPQTHEPHTWWVEVDQSGGFRDSTYVIDAGDVGVTFTLVATSRSNPQQSLTVQFTDGREIQSVTFNGTATVTVAPNASISARVRGQLTGNSNNTLGSIGIKAHVDGTAASTAVSLTCFDVNPNQGPSSPSVAIPFDHTFSLNAPANPAIYDVIATSYSDNACLVTQAAFAFPVNNGITVQVLDQTSPTVTIDQAATQTDPTNASPINFTVVFSEPVTDFATGDVTLTGTAPGTLTGTVTGGPTTFNVAVAGMTGDGTVIANIAPGVAHDAANNPNTASTSTDNTVTFDQVGPNVTINQAAGQTDPTNTSPINFTVVFTKPVSGFATGDVTLTGTAPGTLVGTVSGGPTTFNVAVTGMTGDGTVIASIAAGKATDLAGNPNIASSSTDNTVTYDVTPPNVTINQAASQSDPTNTSPINFTVVFDEPVTGFATGDVTLTGTAAGTLVGSVTGGPTTFNVAVSGMNGDGTVIASIAAGKAKDLAGNNNTASTSTDNTVTYDITPPEVTINQAGGQVDPTGTSPINFTAEFSEPVVGFATGDVTVNGTAPGTLTGAVTGSSPTFNVAVSGMTGDGTVVASIAAGKVTDLAGNPNNASSSTDNSVLYDKTPPAVAAVQATPNPTNGTLAVELKATATDVTTKVASARYYLDGLLPSSPEMSASDGTFDGASEEVKVTIPAATINGLSEGNHTLCVEATDIVGNQSLYSATCTTLVVDKTPPVISALSVQPNPVAVNTTFLISATFADPSNVVEAQYSLAGGAAGSWEDFSGSFGGSSVTASATRSLANPDVLDVCVRGKDGAGNTNQLPADATIPTRVQCFFVAVYDPTAGFVTGGGWIMSPTGAYAADLTLTGKATFGFVSKYLKGASLPTGNTEFQFHAGNLNFSSTAYEWLVVQGSGAMKATYKGTGTVNGAGGYGFLLAAIDGAPDKFRIKIWQIGGAVVYDNQLSAGDNADPTTALAGGSIMIHVPKGK
jgi:nitrogen fixation protein FixH